MKFLPLKLRKFILAVYGIFLVCYFVFSIFLSNYFSNVRTEHSKNSDGTKHVYLEAGSDIISEGQKITLKNPYFYVKKEETYNILISSKAPFRNEDSRELEFGEKNNIIKSFVNNLNNCNIQILDEQNNSVKTKYLNDSTIIINAVSVFEFKSSESGKYHLTRNKGDVCSTNLYVVEKEKHFNVFYKIIIFLGLFIFYNFLDKLLGSPYKQIPNHW